MRKIVRKTEGVADTITVKELIGVLLDMDMGSIILIEVDRGNHSFLSQIESNTSCKNADVFLKSHNASINKFECTKCLFGCHADKEVSD